MFKKILIANRGEIVNRIAKTAKAMKISTVAVYSDIDCGASHTKNCDIAVPLGGSTSAESYLNADRILAIAKEHEVDAIHPGYGFLSENAGFCDTCQQQNIVFIGPTPAVLRIMGNKDTARMAALKSGIPVMPGYDGAQQEEETLIHRAANIGYPLLIKATAGGGGKGMRIVTSSQDFVPALESAKRESLSSFGDDRIILEKFMPEARHIEVQIFADSHGNTVHLFERDCSMQRRYQKVIEESPALGIKPSLRGVMTDAAIALARSIGYLGAGTVEFLVLSDEFYFMEMNTRLQVEHSVTEVVTGKDLVEWQILVASGDKLPSSQKEIKLKDHAIEARIYAETPDKGFLPATGEILLSDLPLMPGVRIDQGIQDGDQISPYYDPMLLKIIARGPDREHARQLLVAALSYSVILGLSTNIRFLQNILEHPGFVAGKYDTQYLARHLNEILRDRPDIQLAEYFACIWNFLKYPKKQNQQNRLEDNYSPWNFPAGLRTESSRRHFFHYKGEDGQKVLQFTYHNGDFIFTDYIVIQTNQVNSDSMNVSCKQFLGRVMAAQADDSIFLHFDNRHYRINLEDISKPTLGRSQSDGILESSMPGTVLEIKQQTGESVSQGDILVVIEAMKMEHHILAPVNGTIQEIYCITGDRVMEKSPLLMIAEE